MKGNQRPSTPLPVSTHSGRACEDTARRQPDTIQEGRPHQESSMWAPWPGTSSLQDCDKQVWFKPLHLWCFCDSPNRPRYWGIHKWEVIPRESHGQVPLCRWSGSLPLGRPSDATLRSCLLTFRRLHSGENVERKQDCKVSGSKQGLGIWEC